MAVCLKCVLTGPARGFSGKSRSRLPVGRKVTAKTLSTKKYKFEDVKVHRDNSEGVLCYRDDKGEMICEGYDEGPNCRPAPGQLQEEQYRQDARLYSFLPGILRPYLVEGTDYMIVGGILIGPFSEGKDEK